MSRKYWRDLENESLQPPPEHEPEADLTEGEWKSSFDPVLQSWGVNCKGVYGEFIKIVQKDGMSRNDLDAVARLVSLAPEMLKACKCMLEAWECRTPAAGIVAIQDVISKMR